ncbi:DUF998 domain-containing protein [Umezawaea sp. NPDC059074]|uniref:DUF998 domain-containing protein n=1 Tax=Umezawaea sp. NPDC059074 TaxID=3346716 RepID=UPI0036A8432F
MATIPRPASLARVSIALLTGCLLVAAYLTVALRSQVNPVANVVSDYVFYHPGGALYVLAVLLLVAGGGVVAAGLTALGVHRSHLLTLLLGLWCSGLLLCAVFPTNRLPGDSSFSGDVHRLAGGTFLTSLPLAGWQLAKALRADPRLRPLAVRISRLATAGLVLAAAFGLCQLAPPPVSDLQGLLERLALGAEVALLLTTATTIKRVTG